MVRGKCISTRVIATKAHSNKVYIKAMDVIITTVGIDTLGNGTITSVKAKGFTDGQMAPLTQDNIMIT